MLRISKQASRPAARWAWRKEWWFLCYNRSLRVRTREWFSPRHTNHDRSIWNRYQSNHHDLLQAELDEKNNDFDFTTVHCESAHGNGLVRKLSLHLVQRKMRYAKGQKSRINTSDPQPEGQRPVSTYPSCPFCPWPLVPSIFYQIAHWPIHLLHHRQHCRISHHWRCSACASHSWRAHWRWTQNQMNHRRLLRNIFARYDSHFVFTKVDTLKFLLWDLSAQSSSASVPKKKYS